jgi:xanthine dehydrogenase accessory factor
MAHETFELLDRLRAAHTPAVMATLVRTVGTTPRKQGAKMFVGANGEIFGSVTIGGCVDARVLEHAAEILQTATPRLLQLNLGDEEAWEIGLTCGGAVDVFVEPLSDSLFELYERARGEWQAGRGVAIATNLAGGSHALVEANELARASAERGDDVYLEVLRPSSTLTIFGASAVAIPLVGFAKALGFRTVVVDGRERFANRQRFAEADEVRVGIVSEIAGELAMDATTAIVLVAHDYKIDLPVLKQALASDAPYIGLLGSRRRGAAILQLLRDDGVAEEQLARVRVPVGLDLGGDTAAEIALSIIAEVVATMHGRSGSPLHARR